MGIDFGIKLDFNWWLVGGGAVLAIIGVLALWIVIQSLAGTRFMRVPDGIAPDVYYRQWRNQRLGRRISRGVILLSMVAVGVLVGGCLVIAWGVFR